METFEMPGEDSVFVPISFAHVTDSKYFWVILSLGVLFAGQPLKLLVYGRVKLYKSSETDSQGPNYGLKCKNEKPNDESSRSSHSTFFVRDEETEAPKRLRDLPKWYR